MDLINKKALVTGSSRGIGKAIALELAARGAELMLHYSSNEAEAIKVKQEIELNGGRAGILQADLLIPENAILLGEQSWQALGEIDFLVNNAGVSYKKHFFDQTVEDIDYFTNINFKSTLLLTQTIARKMAFHNVKGSIYTLTSINGIQPGVGHSVYGATKGAVETLMKGVALELAPHGIMVNTLAVGAIETDMTAAVRENALLLNQVNENIPMGRMGYPHEIARVLADLLSSGTYITGTSIKMDGGWLLKSGFVNPQQYNFPEKHTEEKKNSFFDKKP